MNLDSLILGCIKRNILKQTDFVFVCFFVVVVFCLFVVFFVVVFFVVVVVVLFFCIHEKEKRVCLFEFAQVKR